MATVKTAISVPEWLLRAMDELAGEEHISRSAAFAQAAEALVARRRNQCMLEQLDAVYADAPPREDRLLREQSKRYAARKVIEEW